MAYQSKTWSLSDEVVAEIDRLVQVMVETTGSGSPNRVLKELLFPYRAGERPVEFTMPPLHVDGGVSLDATGPELSSGKGKATVETRGIRPKGDSKR